MNVYIWWRCNVFYAFPLSPTDSLCNDVSRWLGASLESAPRVSDCTLSMDCTFEQFAARSLIECAFITTSVRGSGCEYSMNLGICNVCIKILSQEMSLSQISMIARATVYPKKYAHGFVVLCFVVVMQSLIMNSHEVFIRVALLALGQSLDCHSASEVSLMDMGKSVDV